jgi:hypothetical protein
MLGLDEEAEGAFGSEGYLAHGLPSRVRGNGSEVAGKAGNRSQSLAELELRSN